MTDLARFLGNKWLVDDMIDAGSPYITRELGWDIRVMIADCHFMESLRCERSRNKEFTPCRHHPLNNAILKGEVDILEVPVNPGHVHWAGIQVNVLCRTFAYRDGFHSNTTASLDDLELLTWYLAALEHNANQKPFLRTSSRLSVPRQSDSHSCGVVFLSSVASEHLGCEPWSQARSSIAHMEWFLRLSETLSCPDEAHVRPFPVSDPVYKLTMIPWTLIVALQVVQFQKTVRQLLNQRLLPTTWPLRHLSFATQAKRTRKVINLPLTATSHRSLVSTPHLNWIVTSIATTQTLSSWARQKELKESAASPGFVANERRLREFQTKIMSNDPYAEFKANDSQAVQCSACAEWIKMRVLYDTKFWKSHRNSVKCRQRCDKGLVAKSLLTFFKPSPSAPSTQPPLPQTQTQRRLPCPGLNRNSDPRINCYLSRSSALGGGAISRLRITRQLFPGLSNEELAWSKLSAERQRMVICYKQSNYKWLNRRDVAAIFSSTCEGLIVSDSEAVSACPKCQDLLKLPTFKNILSHKMPDEQNMKFYKGVRQLLEEDDSNSLWLRFAKGVADGLYRSQGVVLGMIEAMYTEALDSFCSPLASTSTRAYRTFQHQFGGRSFHSIQALRARQPRFQPGISNVNIDWAAKTLRELPYSGPLSLAWDDTDLEKALPVWQQSESAWAILGSVQGPIHVNTVDEVDKAFEEARLEKAEKLRIWVLTIPLPKIPPILLAAVARSSKDTAEELSRMHFELTELMHQEGLHTISLPPDGTDTEHSAQCIIAASTHEVFIYGISNKVPGCTVELTLPLFHSRPSNLVQDSKHGTKTARNQLFTGARLLALGNFPMYYRMLLDMALGPLFRRDTTIPNTILHG
ncbi:hypothetical protein BV22DRAFT_1134542 [Leucogyrophana mollusca]|uniref:Uncharacterized protein n=1 Tax=Leucogyrophana mollusca TaxID=85980 RepID=A0ACB8B1C2_9AGAM|nr:hypothetical protein BV22DRAFT_1134542 [Leucogyrophana mollusca]